MPIIVGCKVFGGSNTYVRANVLLDNSSTASYITTKTAKKLRLNTTASQWVNTITLGNQVKEKVNTTSFNLKLPETVTVECTVTDKIIPDLPSAEYKKAQEFARKRIEKASFNPITRSTIEVDILIGIPDLPKIYTEELRILDEQYVVHKTALGYYIIGNENNTTKSEGICLVTNSKSIDKIMDLETLELKEDGDLMREVNKAFDLAGREFSLKEDEETKLEDILQKFYSEIKRTEKEGVIRYQVPLLFKKSPENVPVNKTQAIGIMNSSIDRLESMNLLEEADEKCWKNHIEDGIFEIVDPTKTEGKHNYVPSYVVKNPKSTSTPLRLVVCGNLPKGNCINDVLLKGINLLPLFEGFILYAK